MDAIERRSEGPIELADFASAVSKAAHTTIEALRGRSRSIEFAAARKVFAVLAVESFDYRVVDFAAFIQKHPDAVSRWIEIPATAIHNPALVKQTLDLVANEFKVGSPEL